MVTGREKEDVSRILFSVKSGHIGNAMIRDFCHVLDREKSIMGIFITMESPTKPMVKEAKEMGIYINPLTGQKYSKIEIVTIQEILDGKKLNLPHTIEVTKKSEKKSIDNRPELEFE